MTARGTSYFPEMFELVYCIKEPERCVFPFYLISTGLFGYLELVSTPWTSCHFLLVDHVISFVSSSTVLDHSTNRKVFSSQIFTFLTLKVYYLTIQE